MSLIERRQPAFTTELFLRVGLVWLIVSMIFVISRWQAIISIVLSDAALTETLTPVINPLLMMGAAMLLASRLSWRLLGSEFIFPTALILALATPVTIQFQPLRIGSDGWQIVAVLAAINGLTARSARTGGWVAGAALGLALTISLALLPLTIVLAMMLALRWLIQAEARGWLVHFLVALALASLAGFAVTRGLAGLSDRCNIFVPGGFGIAAAGTGLLALAPRMPRLPLLLALGLIAAAALGGSLLPASQCAAFNPLSADYGLGTAIPVWHHPPAMIAQMMVPPVIGLIAALQLYGRSHAWLARFWLEYALLLAGALLFSIFHADSSAFACALAAAPLAWQLHRWLRTAQAIRRPLRRIPAFAAMVLAVMPGLPLMTIASL